MDYPSYFFNFNIISQRYGHKNATSLTNITLIPIQIQKGARFRLETLTLSCGMPKDKNEIFLRFMHYGCPSMWAGPTLTKPKLIVDMDHPLVLAIKER